MAKQIKYNPTVWEAKKTVGTATVMNNLESGIVDVTNFANELSKQIESLPSNPGTGSGTGLTPEQVQQLESAYTHSQEPHVQKSEIPSKTSQLQNDSNYATENFVTTKIEEVSTQIKCSYLGLTPSDDKGNNHQLLCNAINMGKSILVDGTYELKTESIGLITKNIDIKGITPDAKLDIQFDSFTNGIFKTNGNIDISIKNIKFTSTLATKIINMANPTGVLGFVEIEGCKFENKMRIFDFVADGNLNPEENFYGLDTFVFKNNIVIDEKYTAIVITDAQYNNVIISDNTICNLSNLFAIISIKNESTYSDELPSYRHRTTITNNYVKNDDNCSATEVTGSYYCFVVLESDYVYYARNHVEGMKTLQDVVCYDIYASSREVVYENNMWKNIIAINPTGSQFYQGTSLMMAKGNNGIRTYRNNTFILEKSFVEKMGKTVNDVKLKLFNNTSNTTWNIEDNKIDVCRLDGQTSGTNANVKFCGNTLKVMNWGNGTITNSSVGCFNIIKDNNIEIKNIITDFQITGCYIKQSEPVLTNYVVTNNVFNITSSKHLYLYDKVSADKSEISNNTYHCNVIGDFGINYDAEHCNLNNLISCGDKWITNKRPRAIYRQLLDIDEYSSSIEFTDTLKQESREHLSLKKMKDMPDGFSKTYVWTIEYFTGVGWQSSTVSFKLEKVSGVSKIIFTPLGESTPQSYDLFSTQGNSKKFNFLGNIPYIATLSNSLDNPYIYFNHIKGAELSQKHYIIKHSIKALSGDVQYVTENMGSGTGLTTEQVQQLQQAHTHSTSPHAPSNAQRNSDITKAEIEAKLTGEITTHTHPGMITAKSYVTYEEFGAKSDGVNDDGVAIKLAHEHANQNNLTVKPGSTKTYYIKQAHSIPIINSTDFNNATFVIDDTVEVDRKKNVFEVKSKKEPIDVVDLDFTVKRSTVKLSNLSGHGLCLVQVVNANKKQYIREGSNSNEGTDQQDYFVIDNEGSVLTDIIWDFEQITSCTLYPFDDTTLIMKNAKFITRSNGKELQTNYFDRGLAVNRSNVILENINHKVENEQPGSPYHGFISGKYCAYLTLKNCSVQSRKAYKVSGTSVWMGSYDIEMYCVVGVKLENVIDVTFDNKERWGVFASNFCKDIVVENSTLSRVDAHQGARNITIRNSVIGNQGLRIIGSGLCLIEDTKILNSTSLITLRSDYGSSWEGTLIMRKIYWQPDSTYAYPRIINFANASNHDFGYTCYFPRLIIDDLEVDDTELLSNGSYSNIPIINNNTAVFGTDITSFTHPYHFTDNIECKNMRTKSDKGFILFNSSTINLYNKNPFTYKVLESTSVNNKKLLIVPNTKIVLDDVKLAKVSRKMNASGNLFAILNANGDDNDGFTNNTNHVLPLIQIKNCENVYAFTSNHPMVLELEDSVVSTLLNVGASTRMNGKATGCSFKPSIDGVYQSVNTNYGDFAFTDCKFDTPLVNSVEEKNPSNLTRIYSFLNSFDSSQNKYNLIGVKMDNCNIYDGSRNMDLSNHVTSLNGIKFWKGSQEAYNRLNTKDNSTLYIIVG